MKILVIGGAGFIGTNLIRLLRNTTDFKIFSIDNYYTGNHKNHIDDVNYIVSSTYHQIDFRNHFEDIMPDLVFHFGEYSRVVPSFGDKRYLMKSNLYGTSNVLNLCLEFNAKLIYSASSSKFGGNENLSPYSWTKSKMVELIKNYKEWFGLNYQICYFYNVYGKNQLCVGDYSTVIGRFKNQMEKGEPLTVVGDGKQTRQFTHVDDITDALYIIMTQSKSHEWYLSSEKDYSILEVAKMFSNNIKFIPKNKGERQNAVNVPNDTKEKLNWKTKRTLEEYVLSTKST